MSKPLHFAVHVPRGFTDWATAVLKPETVEALRYDTVSAEQVRTAYTFALSNPCMPGTNADKLDPYVVERHRKRQRVGQPVPKHPPHD